MSQFLDIGAQLRRDITANRAEFPAGRANLSRDLLDVTLKRAPRSVVIGRAAPLHRFPYFLFVATKAPHAGGRRIGFAAGWRRNRLIARPCHGQLDPVGRKVFFRRREQQHFRAAEKAAIDAVCSQDAGAVVLAIDRRILPAPPLARYRARLGRGVIIEREAVDRQLAGIERVHPAAQRFRGADGAVRRLPDQPRAERRNSPRSMIRGTIATVTATGIADK